MDHAASSPSSPRVQPATFLATALRRLQAVEKAIAIAAILAAAFALTADLTGREIVGQGLFGAQRAAVHLTFVAGLLGFAVATGTGSHLRIKASDTLLPKAWTPVVERLGSIFSALLLLVLAWYAARFVLQTASVGERSPTLAIPIWPIQAVLVWAFGSAALRHLAWAIEPRLKPAEPAQP
jgi:TRAP-type C4-dicarboxylate transport system permease small subunit